MGEPLALLYDIHGNLPALEAVLGDVRATGAGRILLGGDYGLFGPWPADTVARLSELEDPIWIRGNVDRWTLEGVEDEIAMEAVGACRSELGDTTVRKLGSLPPEVVLDGVRYCHASPVSDLRSFGPEPAEDDGGLLGDATESRIVFGHTHLAFARPGPGGVELVNPGSVGMPLDGDHRAAWALVHPDGRIEHRRVPYDHEHSAAAVRERFGDAAWAVRSERRLREARL